MYYWGAIKSFALVHNKALDLNTVLFILQILNTAWDGTNYFHETSFKYKLYNLTLVLYPVFKHHAIKAYG